MFTRAITKKPCKALIDGISTAQFVKPGEKPEYELSARQHDKYVEILESLGLEVLDLEREREGRGKLKSLYQEGTSSSRDMAHFSVACHSTTSRWQGRQQG